MKVFKTKKRIQELEKRVADLEVQVQGQQENVYTDVTPDGILIRTNRIVSKSL